ncbi:Hypothetical predicted protein [Mytilus galloprovincialis]|uniref:Uncharacterized protein n=1 Tax=Mytilus galloprovincialis TaxID=29158 RepID=A0A8B6FC78_MYTGA|nr:Hypothetical predicted protein [Mytilus galloprovincialis]
MSLPRRAPQVSRGVLQVFCRLGAPVCTRGSPKPKVQVWLFRLRIHPPRPVPSCMSLSTWPIPLYVPAVSQSEPVTSESVVLNWRRRHIRKTKEPRSGSVIQKATAISYLTNLTSSRRNRLDNLTDKPKVDMGGGSGVGTPGNIWLDPSPFLLLKMAVSALCLDFIILSNTGS